MKTAAIYFLLYGNQIVGWGGCVHIVYSITPTAIRGGGGGRGRGRYGREGGGMEEKAEIWEGRRRRRGGGGIRG